MNRIEVDGREQDALGGSAVVFMSPTREKNSCKAGKKTLDRPKALKIPASTSSNCHSHADSAENSINGPPDPSSEPLCPLKHGHLNMALVVGRHSQSNRPGILNSNAIVPNPIETESNVPSPLPSSREGPHKLGQTKLSDCHVIPKVLLRGAGADIAPSSCSADYCSYLPPDFPPEGCASFSFEDFFNATCASDRDQRAVNFNRI